MDVALEYLLLINPSTVEDADACSEPLTLPQLLRAAQTGTWMKRNPEWVFQTRIWSKTSPICCQALAPIAIAISSSALLNAGIWCRRPCSSDNAESGKRIRAGCLCGGHSRQRAPGACGLWSQAADSQPADRAGNYIDEHLLGICSYLCKLCRCDHTQLFKQDHICDTQHHSTQ